MKNIKYIGFVIVLFFISCDENQFSQIKTIEFPEHTPKLAVTAKLSNSFSPKIFVSHSQKLLDNRDYEVIDNASVNLFKGDDFLMDFTWDNNSRRYLPTGILPEFEEGVEYKLEASASGYEPIVATQMLPKNCEIVNVEFIEGSFDPDFGGVVNFLEVEIKDDGSVDNFYSLEVFQSGTFPNNTTDVFIVNGYSTEDPIMVYGYDDEYTPDGTFNGGNYIMRFMMEDDVGEIFDLDSGGTLDKLIIQVNSYTKEYYYHDISVQTFEDSQDIPFVEPVLISTNWDNGFGIFGILNSTTYDFEM